MRRVSRATNPGRRPLLFASALAAICAGGAALAWVFDAPAAGALIVAGSSPGILVTLYEILRVLDEPLDAAARRSCTIALLLLLVPIAALIAMVAHLSGDGPWTKAP